MNKSIEIQYALLSYEELSAADKKLIDDAHAALDGAHAPYSHFHVGSAVRLQDDQIYTGNNQENAAYPSGLCAERVALFAAKSQTKQPVKAITVVARNAEGKPADAFSCGNCRQVMLEYATQQETPIKVIMSNSDQQYIVLQDLRQLLPFSFDAKNLSK